jgi:hypothetical protein
MGHEAADDRLVTAPHAVAIMHTAAGGPGTAPADRNAAGPGIARSRPNPGKLFKAGRVCVYGVGIGPVPFPQECHQGM